MTLLWMLASAQAWELMSPPGAWESFPVEQVPPVGEAPGLQAGQTVAAIEAAQNAWLGQACTEQVTFTLAPPQEHPVTWGPEDELRRITLGDPDDLLEVGVMAATITRTGPGTLFLVDGIGVSPLVDTDIAINPDADFGPTGADLQEVLAHEMGHALGFGHSEDPDAVMYWDQTPETGTLSPDDVDGLQALYGAGLTASCSPLLGSPPLEVQCELSSTFATALAVTWKWGDGTADTGLSNSHTFTDGGSYVIEVCADVVDCEIGLTWCDALHVSVCPAPAPAIEVRGTPDPLVVQLLNNSPVTGLGCLEEAAWTVTDEAGEVVHTAFAWEPWVALPAEGTYTATLALTAYTGDVAEAELSFHTDEVTTALADPDSSGCGCASRPGAPATGFLAALALVALGRRRSTATRRVGEAPRCRGRGTVPRRRRRAP